MKSRENKNISVLIIEDNPADIKLVSIMLKEDLSRNFSMKSAGLLEEGMKLLGHEKFDAVLLDLNLPDNYALAGLEKIHSVYPATPVILLTSLDDEITASNALQKNAADYLVKGQINTNLLARSIRYAIERNKKENELRKLNRTLHALSESSKAMMLSGDELAFLKQVCGIIVDDCGYSMVWIGYSGQDEAKTIEPIAHSGFEDGYLKKLNLTWADTEMGRGPTGTAVRTGKPVICRNMLMDPDFKPWREEALKRGYASSIAIPMNIGGKIFGALTIYSKETDPFSEDEVGLLLELAGHLVYGIMAIRSRITKLKAEDALRESRERLDIALSSSRMATFDWDIVSNKRTWSDGVHSLLGTNPKTFTGRPEEFFNIMHPEDRSRVQNDIARAVKTGIYETEYRVVWKDGSIHHIAARGKVHYDNTGKAVQLTGVCWDVTARKEAEEVLRESERRWQVHALRFSLLSDIAGKLLESPEPQKLVESLCRRVMEHLDCQVFFNFLVDDKKGKLHLNACGGIAGAEAKRIEWVDFGSAVCGCVARDGCRIVAEHIQSEPDQRAELVKSYGIKAYACHPLLAESGKIIGTLSFGTKNRDVFSESDLSFMKAVADHVAVAMARLKFERELNDLARYPSDSPSPILRLSNDGVILYANIASSHLLKTWNCAVNDTAPEQARTMAAKCLASGHNSEHEIRCGEIIYSLIFCPVAAEGFVNVYGRDITKRKLAEEALKKDKDLTEKLVVERTRELLNAQVELEKSKRLSDIGTLAATVAHELRNPLGVIRTAVYNINRKKQDNSFDSHIANIEKKITESNQIINNLLGYSRIKLPSFEKVKVYSILEECVNNEKERFDKKNINFINNYESIKNLNIEADPLQLKEVFSNILDNACQAIDKNSGRIDITAALDGNKNVIISIEDNGSGIEPEDIKRLFEPFFSRKSKGTGLGLTICNQLINLHNGSINVESSFGKGTKMTLSIPIGESRNEKKDTNC